jgi:hypothetical protein
LAALFWGESDNTFSEFVPCLNSPILRLCAKFATASVSSSISRKVRLAQLKLNAGIAGLPAGRLELSAIFRRRENKICLKRKPSPHTKSTLTALLFPVFGFDQQVNFQANQVYFVTLEVSGSVIGDEGSYDA